MTVLSPIQKDSRISLGANLNVIKAVTVKAWLHLVRYPTWVLQLLVWPIIFPASFILIARAFAGPDQMALQLFNQATGTDNYIGFIVVGTMVWMWQNIVLWDVGFSLRDEQLRGTLESNWLSPAWRFSLMIGTVVVQMFTVTMMVLVTYLEYRFLFQVEFKGNLGLLLLVLLISVPSIFGIGIAFASLVIRLKEANGFVFLVRGLVMIFCGVSYPLSVLPDWMKAVSQWLPQTYLIRMVREITLVGGGWDMIRQDFLILLAFGVFWLLAGYLTFTMMEHLSRRSGAIGQY